MPRKQRSLRVEAVVLHHSDWGEADRLLVLYTKEMGKLRVVAKGVRRLRSRKAGHLEPFTRSALLLARGRDLWIVTQAETIEPYQALRDDLLRMGYAMFVVELLDKFSFEEGSNLPLYKLLVATLERVAVEEEIFPAVVYYEIRLLKHLGYRPELFHCVGCGKEIQPQNQFFSFSSGGVLCPNCGRNTPASRPVSMQALKYLRNFQRSSFDADVYKRITKGVQQEMESLLQDYMSYHLERKLNSPGFLREVRKQY